MRNKKLANILLTVMLLIFIVMTLIRIFILDNFIIELLSFISEAALVGGIADWFAITALFKAPLGFSWHTAIIPKNKKKVIVAMSHMVENELLSPAVIKNKLEQLDLLNLLIKYIDQNDVKNKISELLTDYSHNKLNSLDKESILAYIESFIKKGLENTDLASQITSIYKWSSTNGLFEELTDSLITQIVSLAERNTTKDEIYKIIDSQIHETINSASGFKRTFLKLSLGIAEGTDSINVSDAAESLQRELIETLTNLKNKDDSMRIYLNGVLEDEINSLKSNEALNDGLKLWKTRIIEDINIRGELEKVLNETLKALDKNSPILQWIVSQMSSYWNNFKNDAKARAWLENYLKETLFDIIKSEHHLIGQLVNETLNSFTDEALNAFIDSKAGNDLHWIRINGSIVGAVVGMLIFVFTNLFYEPVVVPLIRGLF